MTVELTVIVPTYNERNNIHPFLSSLDKALQGIRWEVIFVDDDSPDGTAGAVRACAQNDARVRCIQRIGRRGLSSACIEGMLASSSPYLAVLDADMQHDETLLPTLLDHLEHHRQDIVVASRYMEGGSTGKLSPTRVLISRFAGALSNPLLKKPLSDPLSGFFVLRRSYLDRTVRRLYGKGFKILLDLVASTVDDVQLAELPYSMRERRQGTSKLGIQVMIEYLMLIVHKLFGRLLPARFLLFSAVGLTGVFVHLATLAAIFNFTTAGFFISQAVATVVAMTSNFFLNNVFTFRDRRLTGIALFKGLLSFYIACGVGAILSVAVGEFLFERSVPYWLAGVTGAIVAAIWNFTLTSFFTWGNRNSGSSAAN